MRGGGWDKRVMAGKVEAAGYGGQEDNSLAESSPHTQGWLSVKTACFSEPGGQKGAGKLLVKLRPHVV